MELVPDSRAILKLAWNKKKGSSVFQLDSGSFRMITSFPCISDVSSLQDVQENLILKNQVVSSATD